MLFSVLAVVFTYGTMFLSHEGERFAIVSVLENLQPFLTIGLAVIFLHEKLSSPTRSVLIFGTVGIFLMFAPIIAGGATFDFQRAILAFLASLGAAIASIVAKWVKRPDAIITISAWQFIIGSLPFFVLSGLLEKGAPIQFTASFLVILFFLAIGTAVTSAVWYVLIQKVDVSRLSVLFFLLPVFGLLLANRTYSTSATALQWIGIIVVISGVILGIRKRILGSNEIKKNTDRYPKSMNGVL